MNKVFFSLCILVLFSTSGFSQGRRFYFSTSGTDASGGRTSVQARSPSTPWKSVAQAQLLLDGSVEDASTSTTGDKITITGGDTLSFKRGDTWVGESLIISKSGTSTKQLVINSYGTGTTKPTLNCFYTIPAGTSSWTAYTAKPGVWVTTAAYTQFGTSLPYIVINGEVQQIGRYPNRNAPNRGYLVIDTCTGSATSFPWTIYDAALPTSTNWAGAYAVLRGVHWQIDTGKITTHSAWSTGSKIVFNPADGSYPPKEQWGYFIENHLSTLDQKGEWWYDGSTKKLYLYWGSTAPSFDVQVPYKNNIIYSSGKSYVTLDDIEVRGAKGDAILMDNSSNYGVISNCNAFYAKGVCIRGDGDRFKAFNDSAANGGRAGIFLSNGYPGSGTLGSEIKDSWVNAIDTIPGMGEGTEGQAAIMHSTDYAITSGNRVYNSGNIGIKYGYNYNNVFNNYIENWSLVLDDNGALYQKLSGTTTINSGNKIHNNIMIHAGPGAAYGTDNADYLGNFKSNITFSSFGLYSDDNMNHNEMYDNVAADILGAGYYLHNNTDIYMHHNLAYNNGYGLRINAYGGTSDRVTRNLRVVYNQFVARRNSSTSIYGQFGAGYNERPAITGRASSEFQYWGKVDSNFITRPYFEPDNVTTSGTSGYVVRASTDFSNTKYYSVNNWKTSGNNLDKASKKSPMVSDTLSQLFLYNDTKDPVTKALSYVYKDLEGNPNSTGFVVLQPFTGVFLMKTTGTVANSAPVVTISTPTNNSSYSAPASMTVSASATDADGIASMSLYINNLLKATSTTSSISYPWSNIAAGPYTIKVVAVDNASVPGEKTASIQVTSTNANPESPTITLNTPAANAQFTMPATINFTSTAGDPDGINRVEYYANNVLVATGTAASSYAASWTVPSATTYSIYAKAYDANATEVKSSVTNPITITVTTNQVGEEFKYKTRGKKFFIKTN